MLILYRAMSVKRKTTPADFVQSDGDASGNEDFVQGGVNGEEDYSRRVRTGRCQWKGRLFTLILYRAV